MTLLWALGLLWLLLLGWLWRRSAGGRSSALYPRDLLAGGLLFLGTIGFFWRTLSGDVYQPADGGDLVSFLFPTYRFAARQLSQGVLPLWNPHLYGGAPFIGDIQAGFLYPPNLLLFLLNPNFDYKVMQWLAIGHLFWAGLGIYVLLRTLRWENFRPLSRAAALFGAVAFQFSDPLLIHLGNLNLIAVLSWLPWVLTAYSRALAERSLRWAAVSGLLFALANFAGHAQSSFYIGLALGIYTVLWGSLSLREMQELGGRYRQIAQLKSPLISLAITLIITLLLTAPILLPAVELARYTERSDFTYQNTVDFSLAPTQLVGLVTPGFFGRGPALHWSLWQRVETPFAGVATLILALAGLLLPPGTRRQLWPWIGLAAFGLLTALGVYAILHGWLTVLLPAFGQLRAPARALVLWALGLAVIAGVGFDVIRYRIFPPASADTSAESPYAMLNTLLKWGALILTAIATPLLYLALLLTQQDPTAFLRASVAALAITLAAGCWLATWALIAARRMGWISGGLFAGLILAVLYFDLSAGGAYTDISPSDPTQGYQHPEIIEFLQADPAQFRIDSDTDIADRWQPDTAAFAGLEDIAGVANPLTLRHWRELLAATDGRGSRLYDLLNAKYVLVRDGTPLPEEKFVLVFDAPGELAVYENQQVLPRAWLVHEAVAVSDPDSRPRGSTRLSLSWCGPRTQSSCRSPRPLAQKR
jgi:predicted membrane protein